MKKTSRLTFLFLCIIITDVSGIDRNSIFRFHRILHCYDNPRYLALDRDLLLGFNYNASEHENPPRQLSIDTSGDFKQNYSMNLRGNTGIATTFEYSSEPLLADYSVNSSLQGSRSRFSSIRGNEMTGLFDSTTSRGSSINGHLSGSGSFRRYPAASGYFRHFFLEIYGSAQIDAAYERENSYDHDIDYYEESRRSTSSTGKNYTGEFRLSPAIGYGRRRPVEPVYKAFEIERKLRKDGVLNASLSGSTLLELSKLIGSQRSFRIDHDRPDKFIMEKITSILGDDPACDTAKIDTYAFFRVYETLSERFPWLYHGFEIRLRLRATARYQYAYRRSTAIRTDIDTSDAFDFDYTAKHPLQLEWTIPVASRLFLSLAVDPSVTLLQKGPLDASGKVGLCFLLTNRIVAEASFSEIPVYLIAPSGKPGLFECSIDFFIEDHISLTIQAYKYFPTYSGWSKWFNSYSGYRRNEQESISGQVRYDF
ncbi:MAG: hypothetical protein JW863_02095 [Chitinispirillaceae bacterium]|nr:hypothetical protein [Chitinispirillaceae bacterium]